MSEYFIVYLLILILALFNIYASYRAVKSDYSDNIQKLFQVIFVWGIPIAGSILVIHMSKPDVAITQAGAAGLSSGVDAVAGYSESPGGGEG